MGNVEWPRDSEVQIVPSDTALVVGRIIVRGLVGHIRKFAQSGRISEASTASRNSRHQSEDQGVSRKSATHYADRQPHHRLFRTEPRPALPARVAAFDSEGPAARHVRIASGCPAQNSLFLPPLGRKCVGSKIPKKAPAVGEDPWSDQKNPRQLRLFDLHSEVFRAHFPGRKAQPPKPRRTKSAD